MKDELFEQLLESVHQAGAIRRGELAPGRTFELQEEPVNPKAIRESFGLSQQKFAVLLDISPNTIRNWEQGRRAPHGAAKALLRVAARHPEVILDVLRSRTTSSPPLPTGKMATRKTPRPKTGSKTPLRSTS